MKYRVKKSQDKKKWIVVDEDQRIANDCLHGTEKEADRHCEALNAFFGGDK